MILKQKAHEALPVPCRYIHNWWQLPTGNTVEVCKLWLCGETGRMMASIRYVDENGDLSINAFDMSLSNITRFGRLVAALP